MNETLTRYGTFVVLCPTENTVHVSDHYQSDVCSYEIEKKILVFFASEICLVRVFSFNAVCYSISTETIFRLFLSISDPINIKTTGLTLVWEKKSKWGKSVFHTCTLTLEQVSAFIYSGNVKLISILKSAKRKFPTFLSYIEMACNWKQNFLFWPIDPAYFYRRVLTSTFS